MRETRNESNYRRRVSDIDSGVFLPGTSIEIIREVEGNFSSALFDFDGTVSLLRAGWQEIMSRVMIEEMRKVPGCGPDDEIEAWASELIARTTGTQTIYQMMDLCEEIERRGGTPLPPQEYKKIYLGRLMNRNSHKIESLRTGRIGPDEMLVPGARDFLTALRERGVRMYLASGTDEPDVRDEAALLGVADFFDGGIYGAIEDYKNYSKAKVVERILSENDISGGGLLGFGDGHVELDAVLGVGGTAIGAATDEERRSGKPDEFKRERLIGIGASVIVPDFSESSALIGYLFGGANG